MLNFRDIFIIASAIIVARVVGSCLGMILMPPVHTFRINSDEDLDDFIEKIRRNRNE